VFRRTVKRLIRLTGLDAALDGLVSERVAEFVSDELAPKIQSIEQMLLDPNSDQDFLRNLKNDLASMSPTVEQKKRPTKTQYQSLDNHHYSRTRIGRVVESAVGATINIGCGSTIGCDIIPTEVKMQYYEVNTSSGNFCLQQPGNPSNDTYHVRCGPMPVGTPVIQLASGSDIGNFLFPMYPAVTMTGEVLTVPATFPGSITVRILCWNGTNWVPRLTEASLEIVYSFPQATDPGLVVGQRVVVSNDDLCTPFLIAQGTITCGVIRSNFDYANMVTCADVAGNSVSLPIFVDDGAGNVTCRTMNQCEIVKTAFKQCDTGAAILNQNWSFTLPAFVNDGTDISCVHVGICQGLWNVFRPENQTQGAAATDRYLAISDDGQHCKSFVFCEAFVTMAKTTVSAGFTGLKLVGYAGPDCLEGTVCQWLDTVEASVTTGMPGDTLEVMVREAGTCKWKMFTIPTGSAPNCSDIKNLFLGSGTGILNVVFGLDANGDCSWQIIDPCPPATAAFNDLVNRVHALDGLGGA